MSQGDYLELTIFVILAGMGFAYPGQKSIWFSAVGLLLLNHIAARMAYMVFPPMASVAIMIPLHLYLIDKFGTETAIGLAFAGMIAGALLTFGGYLSPLASVGLAWNFWSVFSLLCFFQDCVMVLAFFTGGVEMRNG